MNELIERLARHALRRSGYSQRGNPNQTSRWMDDASELLSEAASALEACRASPTKQLEWASEPPYRVARVPLLKLHYATECVWEEGKFLYCILSGSFFNKQFATLEAAKAAAQADYECRIRSALEAASSPAPGEAVAWQYRMRTKDADSPWTPWTPWLEWRHIDRPESDFGGTLVREFRPLYASPPTSPPEPVQGVLEALKEAEETLRLSEHPAFRDPVYGAEVEALGRRIGFGALMSSASASWRAVLMERGDPVGSEFVAGPCHATVIRTLRIIRAAIANAERFGGWKDISTAPDKEYSSLLSWSKDQGQRIVFVGYHHGEKRFYDSDAMEDGCNLLRIKPTHWQPLPASPSSGDA